MNTSTTDGQRFRHTSITKWSLASLAIGLALGLVGHVSGVPAFSTFGVAAKAIGDIWIAALQMIALPLAIALMLSAIGRARAGSVGALGIRAVLLFVAILVAVGLFTLFVTPLFLARYSVDQTTIAAMKGATAIPESVGKAAEPASIGTSIGGLASRNIFEAAVRGQIFPLLLFTILFGLAVTRLSDEQRIPLTRAFQAFAQAMLVMVRWVIIATPIGVFALSYVLALRTGGSLTGMLGVYLLTLPGMTLLIVILLYLISVIVGRIALGAFARAVAPAQIVAVSTRSSVAALPALVEGGRKHMRLRETARDFVLPLSVSLFRVSHVISNPVKLVFLAHVYGISLQPAAVALFLITVIIFSFSSTGTPNSGGGGSFRMLPVFLAAGIPTEGVIIIEAVETIPDIFDTLVNVTGQMSATTILSRASRPGREPMSASKCHQPP